MKALLILLTSLLIAVPAFASTTTLSWDASPTAGVEYYTIYQADSSGQYGVLFDGITDLILTWETTGYQGSYEFYVTANMWGEESVPSNVVSKGYGRPDAPGNVKAQKNK